MKDETIILIKLINENKTLNEISTITGLSHKQLFTKFSMIKKAGYLIDRNYHYNGEISYSLKNPFFTSKENQVKIEIPNDITSIRMLLMSDLHLGHVNDNLHALDKSFEYCIKENIHNIINLGDFFNGVYESDFKNIKHNNSFEQIKYVLNNYPYVENILTYLCLGNHDAKFWFEDGLDIKEILLDRRHDIIPIGYGRGKIEILNNLIYLVHPIEKINLKSTGESLGNNIILRGHSHKFKIDTGSNLTINVPSLSNLAYHNNDGVHINPPSILDLELKITIENGKIQSQTFNHLIYLNNEFVKIGEFNFAISLKQEKQKQNSIIIEKPKLTSLYYEYPDIEDNLLTKTLKR